MFLNKFRKRSHPIFIIFVQVLSLLTFAKKMNNCSLIQMMEYLPDELLAQIGKILPEGFQSLLRHVNSRFRRLVDGSKMNIRYFVSSAELIRWAKENGCPWDSYTCSQAAEGGHLEVLRWIRTNDCPWDSYTCTWAAKGGHLEILKWAWENGCPWDSDTCAKAARGGHLEVLKWARENGCPEN